MKHKNILLIALLLVSLSALAIASVLGTCSPIQSTKSSATQPAPLARGGSQRVPVIYCTDLFHPYDDPDDHFDLATLFSLPELDVKAILLDQGDKQKKRPGRVAVEQILKLTGRRVPYATGLLDKLKSPDDTGLNQPLESQGAIELLLKVLRKAPEPVTIITTGSVRDVCAAFNRKPALLRRKVSRLYINIGNADGGSEWNVSLDPKAYVGLLRSGLPIFWCPCFPYQNSEYSTRWRFRHAEVLEAATTGLQNFFIYALQVVSSEEIDPMKALKMNLRPWRHLVWLMGRDMWSTASLLAAAGRQVYRVGESWKAVSSPPLGGQLAPVFAFVPARTEVDDEGRTKKSVNIPDANVQLFIVTDQEHYGEAMRECLRDLFQHFPVLTGQ